MIYIIISLFYVIGTIVFNVMPEFKNGIIDNFGKDAIMKFNVTAAVTVIINVWYFCLARRVADGKSNGTLCLILLVLGTISSVVNMFIGDGLTKSVGFEVIIDLCSLYFVIKSRNEK